MSTDTLHAIFAFVFIWSMGATFAYAVQELWKRNRGETPFMLCVLVVFCLVMGWVMVGGDFASWLFRKPEDES